MKMTARIRRLERRSNGVGSCAYCRGEHAPRVIIQVNGVETGPPRPPMCPGCQRTVNMVRIILDDDAPKQVQEAA